MIEVVEIIDAIEVVEIIEVIEVIEVVEVVEVAEVAEVIGHSWTDTIGRCRIRCILVCGQCRYSGREGLSSDGLQPCLPAE